MKDNTLLSKMEGDLSPKALRPTPLFFLDRALNVNARLRVF